MQAQDYLPFDINGNRFALELNAVLKVLPFLSYSALPGAPEPISGIANLKGQVVPVADLRVRFGWSKASPRSWTPAVWVTTQKSDYLLLVDAVWPVVRLANAQWVAIDTLPATGMFLSGVMSSSEGLLLVQNLDELLSAQEWEQLHERLVLQRG